MHPPDRTLPMQMLTRLGTVIAMAALLAGAPASLRAQTSIELSPDTTVALGAELLGAEEVGEDDLAGGVVFTGVGIALPSGTNVVAFGRTRGGDPLFATDVSVDLGTLVANPGDVIRVSGGVPFHAWDASLEGLPDGARVDAVAEAADGSLLLSFDVTVEISGTTFADEDVVRIDASTGAPSLVFDGSAEGIATGLDVDAVHELTSGNLLLSFDGSGAAGGVDFADEDVLAFSVSSGSFAMRYDGSVEHPGWSASDLDAVAGVEAVAGDADGDGIPDGTDNCPFFANPAQLDSGGVGFGSPPDGIGDACQCGDVNGSGDVTTADALIIRRSLLVPPTAEMARPDLCDVGGGPTCSTADPLIIRRALLVPPTATITQQCAPAMLP